MYDIIQNFWKKCPNIWPNLPNLGNFRLFENRFSSILKPGFGFEFKTGIPVFKTDFGLTNLLQFKFHSVSVSFLAAS